MTNNEIFERAKAEIDRRREAARAEADMRAELLRSESPEIKEIDEELSLTGMKLFRAACFGEDISPLRERNRALQTHRREIIVSLGHPEDYDSLHYSCPECSDSGYIDGFKMCKCLRALIIKGRIENSAMGKLIEKQSFDNFDLSYYSYDEKVLERMTAILAMAKNYVRDFDKKRGNLLLIGKTGTGKTHISTAIARELIYQGYDVIYDSAQNIISDFEADRFRSNYGKEESKAEKYLNCTLLIIDDLGTEFQNAFTVSTLYNLLNARQNSGLATVISTNLSAKELEKTYADRIYSRIIGAGTKVLPFEGKDRRVTK